MAEWRTTFIDAIITREGRAFTNDPADRGGPTKFGITQARLAEWRGHPVTAADVEALEEPEAREIFDHVYIAQYKFHLITDAWVREFVIDTGVLQGQETAAKMLQRVLNVPRDGDLGPNTMAELSLALARPQALRVALVRERMHLLLDAMLVGVPIDLRQTTNLKYRHGWTNRVLDFMNSVCG